MDINSTLLGLGLLAIVVGVIAIGIGCINAWESRRAIARHDKPAHA